MSDLLDLDALPRRLVWNETNAGAVSLHHHFGKLNNLLTYMQNYGLVDAKDSFGFAMGNPDPNVNLAQVWDDPQQLVGLVHHFGPEGERYAANAVRKLRAAAREGVDTEILRIEADELGTGGRFRDTVESNAGDTVFAWGDFPFDGAVWLTVQGITLPFAVSAFPKEQDPGVARLYGNHLALAMHYSNQLAAA